MADTKISALPASTTPLAGTEVLPIVQSSTTKQVSVANLTAGRAVSAASVTASTGNFVVGASGQGITSGAFSLGLGSNGNTSAVLIDTSNRALINTTTVGGSLGGSAVLTVAGLSGQDTAVIRTTSGAAGNLPLGVYNDAASGDNALLYFYTNATPAYKGGVDYNRAGNLIRYNTSSDGTLKNIIGDSDGSRSIEILKTTRLRDYTWKDDPEQNVVIGPIAQELYNTYKGAVSVGGDVERERDITEDVQEEYIDENGDTQTHTVSKVVGTEKYTTYRPWAVDKTAFSFHLVAGWQAHEKTIAAQQKLIEQLIARIEALEAK